MFSVVSQHAESDFENGLSPVPISGKVYGKEELRSLVDSSLDFWLTTGRFNAAFEKRLGGFLGRRIVELLLERGDEVTFLARGHYPEVEALGARGLQVDLCDAEAVASAVASSTPPSGRRSSSGWSRAARSSLRGS